MDDIELIKQKLNIVDLIQEYLPLKKSGVNFKANCPFHQEKTPSFIVSPERQIWHCFGCQKGGDIYKFLMEKEGVEFKDALETLAKKAGVVLKKSSFKHSDTNEKLYELNQKASQFFSYMLQDHPLGKEPLEYLKKRGLSLETIKKFNLGYAPLNWESLIKFLKKRGFKESEIVISGLAVPSKRSAYDRFRGRIMFPLVDVKEKIVGFAGRVMFSGEPKYINSPQTPIFDKGKFLFGLNLAKGPIRQSKKAIIVEGEMDMILSFQSGVENIVASKGTALTDNQLDLIKKYAETILVCFDMDLAGDWASRRAMQMADARSLNIEIVQLPEGVKDAAEACLKDAKAWMSSVEKTIPIFDFYLTSAAKRYNYKTAKGKKDIFAELLPIWATITDPIMKDHYIQKLAALLAVKDDLINSYLRKFNVKTQTKLPKIAELENTKKDAAGTPVKDEMSSPSSRRALLEEYLIALLLHMPNGVTYVPNFPESIFTKEALRQIYVLLVLWLDKISFKSKDFKVAEFVSDLPSEIVDSIDRLYLLEIDPKLTEAPSWQKEVNLVISELKKMLIKSSLERLSLEIKQAQEMEKLENLQILNKRFRDLSVKLKAL